MSFGDKTLPLMRAPFDVILHTESFPTAQELHQSESVCKSYAHSKVDLPVFTPIVPEDAASTPIIHGKGASHVFVI